MNSIEKARNIRTKFQQSIVGRGFTEPQAERLTGIEVLGSSESFPRVLLPYGIIDPGRMTNGEFKIFLNDFPELLPDYYAYLDGYMAGRAKFQIASSFTEEVVVDKNEMSMVINIMFQKSPGKFEIR
mgnify:CR=1 FL=1